MRRPFPLPMRCCASLLCSSLCLLALSSCIDHRYDLTGDIDLQLSNHIDLTLPSSSTSDIVLRNLTDLKEEGILQLVPFQDDSIYVTRQHGQTHIDPIRVKKVTIDRPEIGDIDFKIALRQERMPRSPRRLKVQIDHQEVEIPEQVYRYDIPEDKGHYALDTRESFDIPQEIVHITRVTCEEVRLQLDVRTLNLPPFLKSVHLDNLTLTLPKELQLTQCTLDGQEALHIEPGFVRLTAATDLVNRNPRQLQIVLKSHALETGEHVQFDHRKGEALLKGDIRVQGIFRFSHSDMDEAALNAYIRSLSTTTREAIRTGRDLHPALPDSLRILGKATLNDDIRLRTITCEAQRAFDEIEPIALKDIPDFLSHPDTRIDLDNPMILLQAHYGLPATGSTRLTLSSSTAPTPLQSAPLTLQGNDTPNLFYLADHRETRYLPQGYEQARFVEMKNLGSLIQRIPRQVNIEVDTLRLTCTDMPVGRDYPIEVHYDVYAPITFGEDFQLVYTGSSRNWDLQSLEQLDIDSLVLTARVSSDLPTQLHFSVQPLDPEGKVVTALEVQPILIAPKAQDQLIHITITPQKGLRFRDLITGQHGAQRLDGLRYRAVLDKSAEQTEALHRKSRIVVKDIRVSAKGMLTYDAN